MPFSGDWGLVEYAGVAAAILIFLAIARRLRRKPAPAGPKCAKCGTYSGVSRCMYCKAFFCQTHMFREAHRCQDWRKPDEQYHHF